MKTIIINDMFAENNPTGGAEQVDDVLIKQLNLEKIRSEEITSFDREVFYILSNFVGLPAHLLSELQKCNYVIMEHGYQFVNKRRKRVCDFNNATVPPELINNQELYKNAHAVLLQSDDQHNIFLKHNIEANFVILNGSVWSEEDLDLFNDLRKTDLRHVYSIYKTNNGIKNTKGAIKYCETNGFPYELIGKKPMRHEFLDCLSKNYRLAFFPTHKCETFSRLVVEAKCLGVEVVSTDDYGATMEDWYRKYSGKELVDFLWVQTTKNLEKIHELIARP